MTNKIAELVKNTTPYEELNFVVTAPLSKRVQDDFLNRMSEYDFAPKEKGSFIRTEEDIPMGIVVPHNSMQLFRHKILKSYSVQSRNMKLTHVIHTYIPIITL